MTFVQRMPVSPGARRVNPLLPEDGTFNEAHRNPLPASHRNELAVRQTAANWESNESKRCAMRFNFPQIGPLSGGWQLLSRFPFASIFPDSRRNGEEPEFLPIPRRDPLSTPFHKYDHVCCVDFRFRRGATRKHPPKWGCDRGATKPEPKSGATLRAAVLFGPDVVAHMEY